MMFPHMLQIRKFFPGLTLWKIVDPDPAFEKDPNLTLGNGEFGT